MAARPDGPPEIWEGSGKNISPKYGFGQKNEAHLENGLSLRHHFFLPGSARPSPNLIKIYFYFYSLFLKYF